MPSIDTWRVESRKSSGQSIYPTEADTLSTEKKLSRCSQRQILLACAISQTVRQTDPVFDRFAYIETSSTKSYILDRADLDYVYRRFTWWY